MPSPIVVSHSELDAYRQCPHKHELAYKQRWSPLVVSPALSIGRTWHEVLAIHYSAIQAGATDQARHQAIAEHLLEAEQTTSDPDRVALVGWMFDGHETLYGTDPQWEVLAVEDQRLMRLPEASGRGSRFYLRMRIDLLVRERLSIVDAARTKTGAKIWLVDHKSGRNLPGEKELDLDDQFGLYTWGARKLGDAIFGSIYSAARTQRNQDESTQPLEERFSRTRLYRTDRELQTIAVEAWRTARAAYAWKPGEAPRAPDTSPIGPSRCKAKCPFTEPCLLGRKAGPGAEQTYLAGGGYEQLTEDEQLAQRGYPEPLMPGQA